MSPITSQCVWDRISKAEPSYECRPVSDDLIVYELQAVADFSEPRFQYLGEKLEDRKAALVKLQTEFLKQLHQYTQGKSFSLRLRKDGRRLRLYLLIKLDPRVKPRQEVMRAIELLFPKEYRFKAITPNDSGAWSLANDLSWAKEVVEVFKPEESFTHPIDENELLYAVYRWQAKPQNTLESLCLSLLQLQGDAAVDILLIPTQLTRDEQDWLSTHIQEMREVVNGKKVQGETKTHSLNAIPLFKTPLENYEEFLKRHSTSNYLFLYSFRIFASANANTLAQVFYTNATQTQPQVTRFAVGHPNLLKQQEQAQALNLCPEIATEFWRTSPFHYWRAQRLSRLIDSEELAGTFRLPIASTDHFPGFPLDRGTGGQGSAGGRSQHLINLGTFVDDAGKGEARATFDREELCKHGVVIGVPGSGKTTAIFNILSQLWQPASDANSEEPVRNVPWLVLEPAKTEYRALKNLDLFRDDLLIFTIGNDHVSPFRFNPFEVPPKISLESHISRLNACFVGAFNLFDPLPLLLDKAIRRSYESKGWYDDSFGGEMGLEPPALTDLIEAAKGVVAEAGYRNEMRDNINASLLQRLESLTRGAKGRMFNTRVSISPKILLERPVIIEMDALNEDEKALMSMFVLNFIYENSRSTRKSGAPLSHLLVVEEAHNLIGRGEKSSREFRANPKEHAIRLFSRMLAEMRALGQGILIADQLPSALAPEAIKQTNLKILLRLTAKDDREEIGNTMDLNEAQMKAPVHFKTGQSYVFLQSWDRVRLVEQESFKELHHLEEPQEDEVVCTQMLPFLRENTHLYMPFEDCSIGCRACDFRTRGMAEMFIRSLQQKKAVSHEGTRMAFEDLFQFYRDPAVPTVKNRCRVFLLLARMEAKKIGQRVGAVPRVFPFCAFLHFKTAFGSDCPKDQGAVCECRADHRALFSELLNEETRV